MSLPSTIGYAIRALTAMSEDGVFCPAEALAVHLDLPKPYLAHVLQVLAREGILESNRGPRGGFRLARSAHHLTVGEILDVFGLEARNSHCLSGVGDCQGEGRHCLLHGVLGGARARFEGSIAQLTIRDLQILELRRSQSLKGRR